MPLFELSPNSLQDSFPIQMARHMWASITALNIQGPVVYTWSPPVTLSALRPVIRLGASASPKVCLQEKGKGGDSLVTGSLWWSRHRRCHWLGYLPCLSCHIWVEFSSWAYLVPSSTGCSCLAVVVLGPLHFFFGEEFVVRLWAWG